MLKIKKGTLMTIVFATFSGGVNALETTSKLLINKEKDTSERKNVLMIAIDDLKPLLNCYGDTIAQTPNFDRLASMGTLFTSAYCQQAVSAASRASLLTGWCPDRTRVWDLKTLIRNENPNVITLPEYFRENGYITVGIGKIYDPRSVDKKCDTNSWSQSYIDHDSYLNSDYQKPIMSQYQCPDTRKAYNKFCKEAKDSGLTKKNEIEKYIQNKIKPATECMPLPDDAYADGAIANGAVDFLNNYNLPNPFFFAVGFKKPHLPFCAPKQYWDLYDRNKIPLATYRKKAENSPDFAYHNCGELQSYSDIPPIISFTDIDNAILPDDKARELIHGYYASISYIDAQLGKVLDALEESGRKNNTIIVLWGDHGWHLGDHGLWNKHTNFEQATHVPLLFVDPDIKGGQIINNPVEFLSIYPTVCDLAGLPVPKNLDGDDLTGLIENNDISNIKPYAVSQYPRVGKMGYSIRDSRYRYTVWVEWKNRKLNTEAIVAEELYDYKKDPNEMINVVSKKEYVAALNQMRYYWEGYKNKIIQSAKNDR